MWRKSHRVTLIKVTSYKCQLYRFRLFLMAAPNQLLQSSQTGLKVENAMPYSIRYLLFKAREKYAVIRMPVSILSTYSVKVI